MQNEIVIFKDLTTNEALVEIELQSKKFVGLTVDMDDAKERKKVKDSAQLISGILKRVDRARIDHSKDYKAKVESEAAMIVNRLTIANKPLTDLTEAYTAKRKQILEAEHARQATIDLSFSKLIDSAMEAIGQTSSVIEGIIDDVACYDFNPEVFQERTDEAVKKHAELMGKLQHMLAAQVASEELEARRAEVEEKERLQVEADQRAVRIKRETEIAEQAKSEAEAEAKKQAIDDKAKADKDLLESEARTKLLKEQAEQQRLNNEWLAYITEAYEINSKIDQSKLAAIAAKQAALDAVEREKSKVAHAAAVEAAAVEARRKDEVNYRKINRAIYSALLDAGVGKSEAFVATNALIDKKIPHTTINY
jgi:hypothetical protein